MLLCGSDTFMWQRHIHLAGDAEHFEPSRAAGSKLHVLVESPVERVPDVHNWADLESAHWDIVSD